MLRDDAMGVESMSDARLSWGRWSAFHAAAAMLLIGMAQGRAWAHQKWLWPNVFIVEKPPVWVSFDVTWSDRPFTAEQGAGQRPLSIVNPDGEQAPPPQVFVGNTKTTAEVELTKPGTYRFESVDPLTYWTRVDNNGKEAWIEKPKNEVQGKKITRSDLYYSEAAAFVTVGEPTQLPAPDEKDPIEIVIKTHPSRLTAGTAHELQVISYGKPVAKATVNVFGPSATGHDPDQSLPCDEHGAATLQLDAAGRYLLACELEKTVADDPKADIHSFNAYLTISVEPRKP
jgi:uncharacterized GH25 family protein